VTQLNKRPYVSLVTWDISARGLFLCTPNPLGRHQLVRMSLILPTTGNLMVLHGMVVDVAGPDDPRGRPVGMDIELYAVDAPTRAAWWDLFCFARDGAQSLDPSSSVRVGTDAGDVAPSSAPPAVTAARSRRAG
jgi:hypothetical protein